MMDVDGSNNSTQPEDATHASDAGLACNCCRRRKLRCSRETPICEHCRKTGQECVYETKRAKPGMKAGAIENVHKRLDTLEQTIAKQQQELEQLRSQNASHRFPTSPQDQVVHGQSILVSLAKEISKLGNAQPANSPAEENSDGSRKRRRVTADVSFGDGLCLAATRLPIPDKHVLTEVVTTYFSQIHPWIPMIHQARFRKRFQDVGEEEKMLPLLQAMTLIAARHIPDKELAKHVQLYIGEEEDLRDWVVAKATKSLTLENLQALIIICFHDIGDGEESRAWSLIGALTRMVEYLQLTVECDETDRLSFSRPYVYLHPAQNWTEAEERRRVFWCVFMLDRFCSITTAWNTSLTSDDVNRRLPCDGITWRKEDPVTTPYFGIWNKSAGRIGNPITFLPSHSATAPTAGEEEGGTPSEPGTSPGVMTSTVDMSTVGAFAYCIEATESLSRVTSYFLQQKVNIKDQKDLSSWLTRFKELDVRLVHWKMLLPRKWKVNIAQQSSRMDPNLTLAHVTHNASMILLHQPIAFPSMDWPFRTRLPSLCSLDTCQVAAIEIATITDHYLKVAADVGPLSNQFAFCLYIAARVLLLHWKYCPTDSLSPEFSLLIQGLETLAQRWAGPHSLGPLENLASKYRNILVDLRAHCIQDKAYGISISAYTTEVKHSKANPGPLQSTPRIEEDQGQNLSQTTASRGQTGAGHPENSTFQSSAHQAPFTQAATMPFNRQSNLEFMPSDMATYQYGPEVGTPGVNSGMGQRNGSVGSGDLGMISQMFLDSQFAEMDRVISFDDGIFMTEREGGCM